MPIAIITGASVGIGRASAARFLDRGSPRGSPPDKRRHRSDPQPCLTAIVMAIVIVIAAVTAATTVNTTVVATVMVHKHDYDYCSY